MIALHANQGAEHDLGDRFVACFDAAMADTLPPDEPLREALHAYMVQATDEVMSYSPADAEVPPTPMPTPHWTWTGPA